jgi:hypothetical protein
MEITDQLADQAVAFAMKMKRVFGHDPVRWKRFVAESREMIATTNSIPVPERFGEMTIVAMAFLVARVGAARLPAGDPVRIEAETMLQTIADTDV